MSATYDPARIAELEAKQLAALSEVTGVDVAALIEKGEPLPEFDPEKLELDDAETEELLEAYGQDAEQHGVLMDIVVPHDAEVTTMNALAVSASVMGASGVAHSSRGAVYFKKGKLHIRLSNAMVNFLISTEGDRDDLGDVLGEAGTTGKLVSKALKIVSSKLTDDLKKANAKGHHKGVILIWTVAQVAMLPFVSMWWWSKVKPKMVPVH